MSAEHDVEHDVTVVGSANVDLVARVPAIPPPGETVLTHAAVERAPGGKGLNQTVAAARSGASTQMVVALGDDEGATFLRETLRGSGVDDALARTVEGPTGSAWIIVQDDGENAIVVDAAANATLDALDDDEARAVRAARVVVLQLEVPLTVVREACAVARDAGRTTVLNAAPARELDDDLLRLVDVLVVNRHEASTLSGVEDPHEAAQALGRRCPSVVVTLGAEGALLHDGGGTRTVPGVPAEPVDTTGAGDTFTGVLAGGLARGDDLDAAARRAAAAAALAVEGHGAVPAIPTSEAIDARLAELGGR